MTLTFIWGLWTSSGEGGDSSWILGPVSEVDPEGAGADCLEVSSEMGLCAKNGFILKVFLGLLQGLPSSLRSALHSSANGGWLRVPRTSCCLAAARVKLSFYCQVPGVEPSTSETSQGPQILLLTLPLHALHPPAHTCCVEAV